MKTPPEVLAVFEIQTFFVLEPYLRKLKTIGVKILDLDFYKAI